MTAVLLTRTAPREAAKQLGFTRRARGPWRRNGFELEQADTWLALRRRRRFDDDPLRDVLGTPGLWRALPSRTEPERWDWIFELPALARPDGGDAACEEGAPGAHPCAPLLAWAESLESGAACEPPPTRDELEAWLPPQQCSVRRGALLAQIELVHEEPRFGLAVPELARVPDALPPARQAWLAELCRATQVHWRLARLGLDGHCVRAEVDLSGAPASVSAPLFALALAALRCATAWALPAFALITDPDASCEALDHHPRWATAPLDPKGAA